MTSIKDVDEKIDEIRETKKKKCLRWSYSYLKKRVPSIVWLPAYKWREDLLRDFLCGFTLACIHVPQALAFSMLANVDLIYGLYTTCFTGIVYTFLGTAHVSSFGPVAIGSMITGEAVGVAAQHGYSNNQVASSLTFLIGAVYLFAFLFRFGILTVIFRKNFISPFICGCTCHILAKSLKLLLGITAQNYYGLMNFPYNIYLLYEHWNQVNYWAIGTSVAVMAVFIFNMFVFKPFMKRFTKIILPIEGLTMLLAALVSYLWDFKEKGVPVVGHVPSELPQATPPDFSLMPMLLGAAVTVALVNFSSSISMSFLFNKDIDPDQEMFAMAVANLICANFQCITIGNSMMRTRVATTLGIRTLMTTLIASLLVLLVILCAGPIFTPMPRAVLGCIIVLSTSLLLYDRFKEVGPLLKGSFENTFMYVIILATTLFADVTFGLLIGFLLSLRLVLREVPSEGPSLQPQEPQQPPQPETEQLLQKNGEPIQVVPKKQNDAVV